MIARRCFVSGRVQGVYYRATVAGFAREAGLAGHARNLPDGRVDVLVCGEAAAVERFIERLWVGSSASKVADVVVEEADPRELQRSDVFSTG